MIREDYILGWIKRYLGWLLEIAGLVERADHEAALRRIEMVLRNLLDIGSDSVTSLTEGEVLARLTLGEPSQLLQDKCVVLAAALRQLGTVCAAQGRPAASREASLLALHLVLGLRLRGEPLQLAEHLPSVAELAEALKGRSLPPRTSAALMIHYEQTGQFAQAENALFDLLEAAPDDRGAVAMGLGFYERLRVLSDEVLQTGDFSRREVAEGLAELEARSGKAAGQGGGGEV